MPYGTPAQLANLRNFEPGNRAPRRSADVNKAITLARKYAPQAVKLIGKVILDESEPIAMRVKCAEIILNKAIPTSGSGGAQLIAGGDKGIEWLELRFVAPGASAASETHRIAFDPERDVEHKDDATP
jgi:hypothetical protein